MAPFENPALASGGTGDVLAGAIGSLLAQGLTPSRRARLAVYLHGLAGDGARERFGDAGVLASDLPDGLAIARRRLAAIAERQTTDKRLGFRVREPAQAATAPPWTATPGACEVRRRVDRSATRRGRPAAAPASGLARAGPRGPRRQSRHAPASAAACPVHPVVKGDAYGHGAIPIARALADAGADGLSVATMDEALELRDAGLIGADPRAVPGPTDSLVDDAMREGITVAAGDADTVEALLAAAGPRRGITVAICSSRSRSRPGSAGAGHCHRTSGRSSNAWRPRRTPASSGCGRISRRARTVASPATSCGDSTRHPGRRGNRARRARAACRGQRGRADGRRCVRRDQARALDLRHPPGRARRGPRRHAPRPPARHVAPRPRCPGRRPPRRLRHQLRPLVPDAAPEPDRDPPARLRRRIRPRPRQPGGGARSRAARPARRQRDDGRGHGRRHGRPGPAGRRRG